MIRSLPGFGDASVERDGAHYYVEIRSLNSKYFKAVLRLPDRLQSLEAELEAHLRRRLLRGSVFCSLKFSEGSAEAANDVNVAALARYADSIREAQAKLGRADDQIDLTALLGLPGVLQPPPDEEERLERARGAVLEGVDAAVTRLEEMRTREGVSLEQDLGARLGEIEERLAQIRSRAPEIVVEFENRLRSRIDSMLEEAGLSVDPVDLVREVGVWAERSDIAEEIARLAAHTEQFRELLAKADAAEPIGRTLDFLTQEMLREANTIASKSADAEIARWIVEVKGAIDRVKEQVQNVV